MIKTSIKSYIIGLLSIFCIHSYGQVINDESYLDVDFLKFKTELLSCVIKKDTTKLKDFFAEHILESEYQGGYITKKDIIELYFTKNAESSWKEMLTILRFGFSRLEDEHYNNKVSHDKTIFKAPSYLKKIDTNNELIILGENVNIRKQPSLKSKIIRTTSYEVFKCDCNIAAMTDKTYQTVNGINWVEIKLGKNKTGYVASKLTSNDLKREIAIAKVNGKWKIISWYMPTGC